MYQIKHLNWKKGNANGFPILRHTQDKKETKYIKGHNLESRETHLLNKSHVNRTVIDRPSEPHSTLNPL